MRRTMILTAALLLLAGTTLAGGGKGPVSETATAGPYTVNLKVLPAESFTGEDAEMVRDGGAEPIGLEAPESPNHHLVAFVKEGGLAVENADVTIRYRHLGSEVNAWMDLPVVRMHVAGKGPATTHYGNNVRLEPGSYEARVAVNGGEPVVFHFTLD